MKKIVRSLSFLLFVLFHLTTSFTQTQVDNKEEARKKLETNISFARNNVAKNEKLLAISDSLIRTGNAMIEDSKLEARCIAVERKKLDKEHASGRKILVKLSGSSDKTEATKAKTELKAFEIQYKADSKNLDNMLNTASRNYITGTNLVNRGETGNRNAKDNLISAQTSLDAAQARYVAMSGFADGIVADKRKKK
jgi:hypothetical protein